MSATLTLNPLDRLIALIGEAVYGLDCLTREDWERLQAALAAVPPDCLPLPDWAQAVNRVRNAKRSVEVDELGAATWEFVQLLRRLRHLGTQMHLPQRPERRAGGVLHGGALGGY